MCPPSESYDLLKRGLPTSPPAYLQSVRESQLQAQSKFNLDHKAKQPILNCRIISSCSQTSLLWLLVAFPRAVADFAKNLISAYGKVASQNQGLESHRASSREPEPGSVYHRGAQSTHWRWALDQARTCDNLSFLVSCLLAPGFWAHFRLKWLVWKGSFFQAIPAWLYFAT